MDGAGNRSNHSVPVRPSVYPFPDLGVKLGTSKPLHIGFVTKRAMQADRAWETPGK